MKKNSGEEYKGDWHNGQMSGNGELRYGNGDVYKGEFEDGQRHGTGEFYEEKTKKTYRGPWVYGEQHGIGELLELSGRRVEALFDRGNLVKEI